MSVVSNNGAISSELRPSDLQTPYERALEIMSRLAGNMHITSEEFNGIHEAIAALSNHHSMYIPTLGEQIEKREQTKMDSATRGWLLELLQQKPQPTKRSSCDDGTGAGRGGGPESPRSHSSKVRHQTRSTLQFAGQSFSARGSQDADTDHDGDDPSNRAPIRRLDTLRAIANRVDGDSRRKSVFVALSLQLSDEDELKLMLSKLDTWNFDPIALHKLTKSRSLFATGFALMQRYDLVTRFSIDERKLHNFLEALEAGYMDNPYHNSTHAAQVAHSAHYFLVTGGDNCIGDALTDVERFVMILASLVHDFQHPGLNNNFLVAAEDALAVTYNDASVLENHHVAAAFRLLQRDDCDILSGCTKDERKAIRKLTIEVVLATDLSVHFGIVGQFKAASSVALADVPNAAASAGAPLSTLSGTSTTASSSATAAAATASSSALAAPLKGAGRVRALDAAGRVLLLKVIEKSADVSHAAKQLAQHEEWTRRITEEFYKQGDLEREMGVPISAFMDRHAGNLAKSQVGFINFLVSPLFETLSSFVAIPELSDTVMNQLHRNHMHWKRIADADEKKRQAEEQAKEQQHEQQ